MEELKWSVSYFVGKRHEQARFSSQDDAILFIETKSRHAGVEFLRPRKRNGSTQEKKKCTAIENSQS